MTTAPLAPLENTAVLMIDMQNAFLDERGLNARLTDGLDPCFTDAIEPAARLLAFARAAGVPVIHTQHQLKEGLVDGGFIVSELYPRRFNAAQLEALQGLAEGGWEVEFHSRLTPEPTDHVVKKNRNDAFIATRLEQLLSRLQIQTLVIAGVLTTGCVESTVRHAAMLDYRVFLPADAIGDSSQVHEDGLQRMGRSYGYLVDTDHVASGWQSATVALQV